MKMLLSRLEKWAVRTESGCLEWQGSKDKRGYGTIHVGAKHGLPPKKYQAHRVAFFVRHGRLPNGFALHKCDNRACIEADHLFEGSNAENMADMVRKGRQARGSRNAFAKLTEAQVLEIRALYSTGKYTQRRVGEMFGVDHSTVSYIVRGETWTAANIDVEKTDERVSNV